MYSGREVSRNNIISGAVATASCIVVCPSIPDLTDCGARGGGCMRAWHHGALGTLAMEPVRALEQCPFTYSVDSALHCCVRPVDADAHCPSWGHGAMDPPKWHERILHVSGYHVNGPISHLASWWACCSRSHGALNTTATFYRSSNNRGILAGTIGRHASQNQSITKHPQHLAMRVELVQPQGGSREHRRTPLCPGTLYSSSTRSAHVAQACAAADRS